MSWYKVKEGDCLANIAYLHGFSSWKTIYNHGENASLRQRRPNPNILHEGDEIYIPTRNERTEDALMTGKQHRFLVRRDRWVFRLHLCDELGTGIEAQSFTLVVDGMETISGKTNGAGLIEVAITASAREGILCIAGEEFPIWFGGLDPIARVKGVQARLNNLGFGAGPVDGIVGPKTREAVYRFQVMYQLQATGDIDDGTRQKLLSVHERDSRFVGAEDDMSVRQIAPFELDPLPEGETWPPEPSETLTGEPWVE